LALRRMETSSRACGRSAPGGSATVRSSIESTALIGASTSGSGHR
jgi:hypothetical protein